MSELLYNNITLPEEWPPRYPTEQLRMGQPVPYLDAPPDIIDITVGRQLFVDDFLILDSDFEREFHRAVKFTGNPVIKPETPIELEDTGAVPFAAPKDGGVWYDKFLNKYRMWYEAGWLHKNAYAESDDGINWTRPELDIVPGTNEILAERNFRTVDGKPLTYRPDSSSVIIDYDTTDKSKRYKLFMRNPGGDRPALVATSGDGIHFDPPYSTGITGDRSTMFYNPFRKKWVFSIRTNFENGRARDYFECDDPISEGRWEDRAVHWLCADSGVNENPYVNVPPMIYNINCVAYESIMLGLYEVWYGPENDICYKHGAPKITELIPIYSRDGFHFTKPTNTPVVNASIYEGAWDRGYVQSVGGVCTVTRDEIRIYYSAVAGDSTKGNTGNPDDCRNHWMYGNGACGFATLRRDGFVSLKASNERYLTTRKMMFKGKKSHFFINASTKENGYVKVEILDRNGDIIAASARFSGDSTCAELDFGRFDLSTLSGECLSLKFTARDASIYSFWFSDSESGESGGYDGAGGPDTQS